MMEMNEDFIGLQGVLLNIKNVIGEFTIINFIGGNEKKLNYIVTEVAKYLTTKGYLKDDVIVDEFTVKLNELMLFLAVNTSFKKKIISNEYSHLLNIVPPLSKCVFSNICLELKLYKQYGFVIEKLPLDFTEEFLDHMNQFLKRVKPEESLNITCCILKCVINKLSTLENSNEANNEDCINSVTIVSNVILQNFTGLYVSEIEKMKRNEIYNHMGFTLLNLFDLLLYINNNLVALKKLLDNIICSTVDILKNITINVFCYWAEVKYDEDQILQGIIAEKAYDIKEKYKNYKFASELNSILAGIARKPKSLAEMIYESDVPTIIKKINQKDKNQQKWFMALLNTSCIFENPDVIRCLEHWWNLCDESAVSKLLDAPLPSNTNERQLIIKCANNLKLEQLRHSLTGYFHKRGFVWKDDTENQLVSFFNQCDFNLTDEHSKIILLLIVQNASLFFYHFFSSILKTNQEIFEKILHLTKDIAKIDNIGLTTLLVILKENPLNLMNIKNYINLFNSLLNTEFYTWDFLVSNILCKFADNCMEEGNLEGLCCHLKILKQFKHFKCELLKEINLYESILICASKYRCKSFLEFNNLEEEVTKNCVEYMLEKSQVLAIHLKNSDDFSLDENINDEWSMYYKALLFENKDSISFIDYILPNFDLTHYKEGKSNENFTKLLKVLSRCVSSEWEILLKEMENKYSFSTVLKALTDIIILFCEITKNQRHVENHHIVEELELGMKFTLGNFARFLILDSKLPDEQILAVRNVCRILRYIPDDLKESEGMLLLNILPEEVLRLFAKDKEFVAGIILINNKQLCKVLAQKVLGGNLY